MNVKPIISVIIPAFNIEREIVECLESLAQQTLAPTMFEIIVIDDGSNDETYARACAFAAMQENIQVLHRKKSGGPGAARNDGVQTARGSYILFLDGDDFLPRWSLATLVTHVANNPTDLVAYNWSYCQNIIDAIGQTSKEHHPLRRDIAQVLSDKETIIRRYLGMNFDGSVIFTLVRRDLLTHAQIAFPDGLHEDVATIFKLYCASNSTSVLDTVLYLKRNRPGSIVNTLSDAHIDGMFAAWRDLKRFLITSKRADAAFKTYEREYASGVLGVIGVLLDRTFTTPTLSEVEREVLLASIYTRSWHYFPEVLADPNLPNSSRYDRLVGSFLRLFSLQVCSRSECAQKFAEVYAESFSRESAPQPIRTVVAA
jgi:glycosyltransferase involved in cell wall biosynthesis